MKLSFVIRDQAIKDRACLAIQKLASGTVHEVIVRPFKKDRSLDQNALYWKWIGVFGEEIGMTKNEMHDDFRLDILMPIYLADPSKEEYHRLVNSYMDMARQMGDTNYRTNMLLRAALLNATSTTDASTLQFTEYLDEIANKARSIDVWLPHPDDRGIDNVR